MRRVLKAVAWILGVLVGLPVVVVGLVFLLLNVDPGRRLAERLAGQLTGGQVQISGLAGRFPDALRLAHAEVRDANGAWLLVDDVALDWSPTRLLSREARVDMLSASRIQLPRLPQRQPTSPSQASNSQPFSLPIRVSVEKLHVDRVEIGAPVAGVAAVASLDGSAHLISLQDGDGDVAIARLDSPGGAYTLHGHIDPASLSAKLDVDEPPNGLIAGIAKLPALGAIRLQASVDGPRTAEATQVTLSAGPLRVFAHGTLDLANQAADLDVTANAPAMTPRPDVSFQAVALDAHLHGPFTKPDAAGHLRVDRLAAFGAALHSLTADLQGNAGAAGLHATIEGLRIPGPKPDLFEASPLTLQADARLDDPARPVSFTLDHALVQAHGQAATGGDIAAHVDLSVPELAPLAAAGGIDLQGRTQLAIGAAMVGGVTKVDVDGTLGITGGQAPVPALVGDAAKLGVSVALAGSDITVSRAQLDGRAINLTADGTDKAGRLDLRYELRLVDLATLAQAVSGAVTVQGTAQGPADDLAVMADLAGEAGTKGFPRGPVTAAVRVAGLPGKPSGTVTADATLEGAPLALGVRADRTDGALHATIERADWKSLHAEGAVTLPAGATLPFGHVDMRMTQLDELRPLIGMAITGAVTATADLEESAGRLRLDAQSAGIPGTRVGRAVLNAGVTDPATRPVVAAKLQVDGIEASGIGGNATLDVNGPEDALALRLAAGLKNLAGADADITAAAVVNATGKQVDVSALQAAWKGQAVRLLAPARVNFGGGVAVDRLRIGLQQATLDVAGRLSPTLDLTAALRNVTADLARPFAPDVSADGIITADARLTGTPARPEGTVKLAAAGLHMRTGPGRALPPANLNATAQLAGRSAQLDARLTAGSTNLTIAGRAPIDPAGALGLRATGTLDLAMLDPILSAQGRRVRGRVTLDAGVAGTIAAPEVSGMLQLAKGEVQDFAQGAHITNIAALIRAEGRTVRIASLSGRAGPGVIAANGSVGLQAPMPIDLTLTMRNAEPLASDRLTANLDADLTLRGQVEGELAAGGKVTIRRAEIHIPDSLPSSVAVLNVHEAGQKPPPPAPGPTIALALELAAPRAIFVRGHGLDAELGGTLKIGGTSAAPQVSGGFDLQRGTFNLAGTTLNFVRGKVGFDGTGVTGKIDPTLDFEADSTTASITAMLLVGGYASAPKITLSSVPSLPQDEVLAQLLFGRSVKGLGPFQYAEIAAALASLSGAPGGGLNPLEKIRKGLGLDRLSVGSTTTNTAAGGANSAPSLEAGRYIANGVYVGAKQDTSGAGTQATVQIDIYKGLKVQTDVGTGQAGSNLGLSYQFEY